MLAKEKLNELKFEKQIKINDEKIKDAIILDTIVYKDIDEIPLNAILIQETDEIKVFRQTNNDLFSYYCRKKTKNIDNLVLDYKIELVEDFEFHYEELKSLMNRSKDHPKKKYENFKNNNGDNGKKIESKINDINQFKFKNSDFLDNDIFGSFDFKHIIKKISSNNGIYYYIMITGIILLLFGIIGAIGLSETSDTLSIIMVFSTFAFTSILFGIAKIIDLLNKWMNRNSKWLSKIDDLSFLNRLFLYIY